VLVVQTLPLGSYPLEAVHVELAQERLEIAVFEVVAQDCLLELERFEDEEAIALRIPPDVLQILLFLRLTIKLTESIS